LTFARIFNKTARLKKKARHSRFLLALETIPASKYMH